MPEVMTNPFFAKISLSLRDIEKGFKLPRNLL